MNIIAKDEVYNIVKNQSLSRLNLVLHNKNIDAFYPNDNYGYENLLHINASLDKEIYNSRFFEVLCEYNCSFLDLKDSYNRTPLCIACIKNNISAILILLSYGADFSLVDSFNKHPFDYISDSVVRNELEKYLLAPFSKRGHMAKKIPYWLDEFKQFIFANEEEELNFLLNLLVNKTRTVQEFVLKLKEFDIKIYVVFNKFGKFIDIQFNKKDKEFFLTKLNPNYPIDKFVRKLDLNYNMTMAFLMEQNSINDYLI